MFSKSITQAYSSGLSVRFIKGFFKSFIPRSIVRDTIILLPLTVTHWGEYVYRCITTGFTCKYTTFIYNYRLSNVICDSKLYFWDPYILDTRKFIDIYNLVRSKLKLFCYNMESYLSIPIRLY